MRNIDLINLASRYFKMGIIAALPILLCIIAGYFVVYKKGYRGQKKITWKHFAWCGIFLCYLCVVFGATLLSRGSGWTNSKIDPLFYSYKDAWVHFSYTAWRNIILNFCLFVPLGFWLPVGLKRFRRFWKVYLAGFGLSLLIECIQLFLKLGLFEVDDLMGNTIGTMIGYGLFALGYSLFTRKGRKNANAISVAVLQLPLLITAAVFGMIFWKYNTQELGNNSYVCIKAFDPGEIYVTGENTFRTGEFSLDVYEAPVLTVAAATEKGEQIFEALGTSANASRNDVYSETIIMYSDPGRYHLWINYQGGTTDLTDFDILYPEGQSKPEPVAGAEEAEIRAALYAIGFDVPKEAGFKELGSGTYQFDAAMSGTEEGILNGTLTCEYYGAENGFGKISDHLITCTPYKTYATISEQEAYEKIVNGEFAYYDGNTHYEIQVTSCLLVYALDSKGYYQPNYQFECIINGKEGQIIIPALKNG